jgi:KDO2-lipid IV(A) lauroyltransferase
MSPFREMAEAGVFGLFEAASHLIPRRLWLGLGSVVGSLGYALDARHRRIAFENLALAFGPTLSGPRSRSIVRECWRHFGRVTFDMLASHRFSRSSAGLIVRVEGLEHLREAYASGRGVLLFTAHYGNWEMAGLMQGYLGFPLAVVARPLDNRRLERRLARIRARSGNVIVHKRSAVREMVRALHERIGVAIVIDQDARDQGIFVPFFGRPASTTPTLAALALRTGAPVIPARTTLESDGTYRLTYGPPVAVESSGRREADIVNLSARCTAIVEGWVRERPEQWLWMHRRWKTAPPSSRGT